MASAGAEKRPGAQEGTALGQSQLTEVPGGHAQNSEVTIRLSSLQTLGHRALGDQLLCNDPLTARTGSTAWEGHGLVPFICIWYLMADPCILCLAMVTSYLCVTSSVQLWETSA